MFFPMFPTKTAFRKGLNKLIHLRMEMTYKTPNNDSPRDIYLLARIHTFWKQEFLVMKYQASMSTGSPGVSEWDHPLGDVLYILLNLTLPSTFTGQITSIRTRASVFFLEGVRKSKINAK